MRVLHVIAINGIGGAEKLLVELAKEQSSLNVEVTCLFFFKKKSKELAQKLGNSLSVVGISIYYKQYRCILDFQSIQFLASFIKSNRFSIIHSHLKQSDFWLAVLKFQKKISVRVISTLHGYRDNYHNKFGLNWNNRAKLSSYYYLSLFICKNLDSFVAISKGVAEFFINSKLLPSKKVVLIYNGYRPILPIKSLKKNYNKIVIIGRLVPFKGHRYLLFALSHLKKKIPSATVHIVGEGPERQNLQFLVNKLQLADDVFFYGFKDNIRNELTKYDVAVVPSIGEPFGMVFLEAFNAQIPVVAFDVPAGNEIIEHLKTGYLAKPFNHISLAKEIETALTENELDQQITKNAWDSLNSKFSLRLMAENYLDLYKALISISV